jgi:hypothetical protein
MPNPKQAKPKRQQCIVDPSLASEERNEIKATALHAEPALAPPPPGAGKSTKRLLPGPREPAGRRPASARAAKLLKRIPAAAELLPAKLLATEPAGAAERRGAGALVMRRVKLVEALP